METGAKKGIDHDVRLFNKLRQLVPRRTHRYAHIARSGATGNMSSKRAPKLIGLDRRHDVDMNAFMRKDVGSDPTVAAVVPKTGKDERAGRSMGHDGFCQSLAAGYLHTAF